MKDEGWEPRFLTPSPQSPAPGPQSPAPGPCGQMTPRERLMSTLQGKPVDRPAVSFYELNGLDENPSDPDPFNIFSHPSWTPLIDLAREKTDRIVLRGVAFKEIAPDPIGHVATDETWDDSQGRRFTRRTIAAGRPNADDADPPRPRHQHRLDYRAPAEGPGRSRCLSRTAGVRCGRNRRSNAGPKDGRRPSAKPAS